MGVWVDSVGGILRDASLAAAGLLSVTALAMLCCRQPVRRIWLARWGILGSLALIPLVGLAPLPRVEVAGLLRTSAVASHPYFEDSPVARWVSNPSRDAGTTSSPTPFWLGAFGRPPRFLVILYLGVSVCAFGWLLLGHLGLECVTRRSSKPSDASLALYEGLPYPWRRPRLCISNRVRRPVLVGLIRKTILVPADLDLPETADQLRLSLLHELAHAERMDSWFSLASSMAQAAWFFLPPLWWIRAQMRLDQEFIADRLAAGGFGALPAYASSLVNIARPSPAPRQASSSVMPATQGGGSALFLRVLMLVQCPFAVEARPPRWWGWSLSGLLLAGILASSCLTARLPAQPVVSPARSLARIKSRSFRMGRLELPASVPTPSHPSPLFELPIPLPDQFELSVDVWGDSRSLAATRVVGRSLNHAQDSAQPPSGEQWHCVRIRRDQYGLTLWIDQHRLPRSHETETTSWLSVEPPVGQPGHFRNLHLVW